MFEFMLSEEEIDIVHEAIDFVSGLPKQLMRDMDEDKIEYPREYRGRATSRSAPRPARDPFGRHAAQFH